jgi:hypothetical protein
MSIRQTLTALLTARTAAVPVAICRIGLGVAALGRALKTARDLYVLEHDPSAVPARLYSWAPVLDAAPEIVVVGGLGIAASIGLIIGYRARLSALLVAGCIAFVHVVDQNFWGHHVYFIGLMVGLLSLTESDAAWSIKAWREGSRAEVTYWPVLLMKIQLSLVYFFTSVAKLNPVFLAGHVLARAEWLPAVLREGQPLAVLAAVTVGAEFFLAFALWVPRLRLVGLAVGLALHGLIPFLFGFYAGLIVFTVATFSVYVLFASERDLARLAYLTRWLPVSVRPTETPLRASEAGGGSGS